MTSRPLFHAIRTHAHSLRGDRRSGFRNLVLAPWPAADRRRIARWLDSLRTDREPAAALLEGRANPHRELAVAVNCFRVAGTLHACLARIDDRFRRDEHGRGGGFLSHALLVPLDESRPPGSYGPALLAASRAFLRDDGDGGDFDAYLDRCRRTATIRWPESVEPAPPEAVDARFLRRFLDLARRTGPAGDDVPFPGESGADLALRLVCAGAFLPPRLRLSCRWGVGLRPGADLAFIARPARTGERLPAVDPDPSRDLTARYVDWLGRQRDLGRWHEVARLAGDWSFRSWDDLLKWTATST